MTSVPGDRGADRYRSSTQIGGSSTIDAVPLVAAMIMAVVTLRSAGLTAILIVGPPLE